MNSNSSTSTSNSLATPDSQEMTSAPNPESLQKLEDLREYEQRLKDYERSLNDREEKMKEALVKEYERLAKNFDAAYNDKVNNIMKRLMTHEKSTKLKIKQFETQLKELKTQASQAAPSDDKVKYKVSSLEKNNDFLMLKLQELEKKLLQEQEAKQTISQKYQKALNTNTEESKEKTPHAASDPTSLQKIEDDQGQESVGVIDFSQDFKGNSQADGDEEEIMTFKKTMKAAGGTKKKTTVAKPAQMGEFKVLLNVIHSLIACLKSTLPILTQERSSRQGEVAEEEKQGEKSQKTEKLPVDLGEVFYPCFDSLITNLTELMPIIGKQYDPKYLSSIVEIYYKLINFFFKFKVQGKFANVDIEHRLLSEMTIQNSTNKIKSSQEHINEIMVPSQVPKDNANINFAPQTDYWKKILKLVKPLPKKGVDPATRNIQKIQSQSEFAHIHLFTEELVQKEVLAILKKFLDSTEFMLRGNEKENDQNNPNLINVVSFHTALNLETQKHLQIMRLYVSFITLLLARTKKEHVLGLQALLVDLSVENTKFAEFFRLFLLENEGLDLLIWIMKNHNDDSEIIRTVADALLSLNEPGVHSNQFKEMISKDETYKILLEVAKKFETDQEYSQKWNQFVQNVGKKSPEIAK